MDKVNKFNIPKNEMIENVINNLLSSNHINAIHLSHNELFMKDYISNNLDSLSNRPFYLFNSSEINSIESTIRQSLKFKVSQDKHIVEGEVMDIALLGESDLYKIRLRTLKESKDIYMPSYLKETIQNIRTGDVVFCEPNIGIIKKLGRSDKMIDENDLEVTNYVSLKKEKVYLTKTVNYEISLFDLDRAFMREGNSNNVKYYSGIREEVDEYVTGDNFTPIPPLILITSAEKLTEDDLSTISIYANDYIHFKFILIGAQSDKISKYFLSFPTVEDLPLIEKLKIISPKISENFEFIEIIKKKLNEDNLYSISKVINISNSSEELLSILEIIQ